MKNTPFNRLVFLILLLAGFSLSAQAQQDKPKRTPEEKVEKWAQQLSLTADQKAKFLELEKQRDATKLPKPDKDASAEVVARYEDQKKAHRAAQRALLTPEQADKYDEIRKSKEE